jgi:hypothetical protein
MNTILFLQEGPRGFYIVLIAAKSVIINPYLADVDNMASSYQC